VVSFLLAFPPISYTHSSSPPFVIPDIIHVKNVMVHGSCFQRFWNYGDLKYDVEFVIGKRVK
jgi:hypothetical protein